VGFAAETGDLEAQARAKLARKGCDWILANDVSPGTDVFGGDTNCILLLTEDGTTEAWPRLDKRAVARRLTERIEAHFGRIGTDG
jgi:phosphopantothenoylcysteine decarboxylase/phosphopantothenate--cysteine ligase